MTTKLKEQIAQGGEKAPESKLRVWWIPQVPMKPFRVDVGSLREGKLLLETLANYDIFQFENRIKPDYSNAGGLEVLEDGEWSDWENEDGQNIDDIPLSDLPAQAQQRIQELESGLQGIAEGAKELSQMHGGSEFVMRRMQALERLARSLLQSSKT